MLTRLNNNMVMLSLRNAGWEVVGRWGALLIYPLKRMILYTHINLVPRPFSLLRGGGIEENLHGTLCRDVSAHELGHQSDCG